MLKFDQFAMASNNAHLAMKEYVKLGQDKWTTDIVTAEGMVNGKFVKNVAILYFNHDIFPGTEFEIIQYIRGDNWLNGRVGPSHIGAHVENMDEAISEVRSFRGGFNRIVQDVVTISHTNKFITETSPRTYRYVIFDAYKELGFDIKLIERRIK